MGDFYYIYPLIHLILGVTKPARKCMESTYIWEEEKLTRDPPISSHAFTWIWCIIEYFMVNHINAVLIHLLITADNCSGQNKNKAMIKILHVVGQARMCEESASENRTLTSFALRQSIASRSLRYRTHPYSMVWIPVANDYLFLRSSLSLLAFHSLITNFQMSTP